MNLSLMKWLFLGGYGSYAQGYPAAGYASVGYGGHGHGLGYGYH